MNRKEFLGLFSATGLAIITGSGISCDSNTTEIFVVDSKKCDGCEKCIKKCYHKAIILKKEKAFIVLDRCKHCGDCESFCKHDAIISYRKKNT